jgi:hypothetical protein
MHIALSVVEHESFRKLILYICLAFKSLLIRTDNTIRRWIIKEFEKQRLFIRHELA